MTPHRTHGSAGPAWFVVCATAVGLLACGPLPPLGAPALCSTRARAKPETLRPAEWFHFLVDRALDGGAADCTGAAIAWREPKGCADEAESPVVSSRFTDKDLITSRVSPTEELIWVVTHHFADGEALGPVALVRARAGRVEVTAVGSLRARTERTRLRMEQLGDGRFLVAIGENCAPDEPRPCRRSMVLLEQRGQHFVPAALLGNDGACVGRAEIDLSRRAVVPLKSGWNRRFELSSSTRFANGSIVVEEQVVVADLDPTRPTAPPRPARRADAERVVRFAKGRLTTSDVPLWSRVVNAEQEVE